MADLLNKQTGQVEQVFDEDVDAALSSGNYTFASPSVDMISTDGKTYQLPADQYGKFRGYNWRLASPEESVEAQNQREFGDRPVETFVKNVVNTATLGEFGRNQNTDAFAQMSERNPISSTAGQVVGAFAPIAPGAGAAFSAAGVAGKVGGAIERGLARSGQGVLARAGVAGAVGAGEGAVLGLQPGLTSLSMSDEPHSVELVASTLGSHALSGAGFGAGVGAGLSILGSGFRAAGERLRKVATDAQPSALDELSDLVARKPRMQAEAEAVAGNLKRQAKAEREALLGTPEAKEYDAWRKDVRDLLPRARKELAKIDEEARRAAAHARKEMAASPPAADAVLEGDLRASLREGATRAEKVGPRGAIEAANQEIEASFQDLQARLKLDRKTVGGRPNNWKRDYLSKLDDEELVSALADPDTRAAIQRHRDAFVNLRAVLRPQTEYKDLFGDALSGLGEKASRKPFLEARLRMEAEKVAPRLAEIQSQLDDIAAASKAGRDPDKIAAQILEVGKRAGIRPPSNQDLLAFARARNYPASSIEGQMGDRIRANWYEDRIAKLRQVAERGHPVAEGIAGVAGAGIGFAKAGPLGAWFGWGRGVGGVRLFSRLWAKRGAAAQRTAKALETFVKGTNKLSKVAPRTAALIASGITYHPDGKPVPAKSAQEIVKARAGELAKAAPGGIITAAARHVVHERLGGIWAHDPILADKLETAQVNRVQFLASKMPVNRALPSAFRKEQPWMITDEEAGKALRYMAAAEDPPGRAAEELANGSLSQETVETLQALSPASYARMKADIIAMIPEIRGELPFEKRILLGTLFGVPVDPSQEPLRAAALQETYETAAEELASTGAMDKGSIGSVRMKQKPTPGQSLAEGSAEAV